MATRKTAFKEIQRSMRRFSRDVIGLPLHRYQAEIADYILRVVADRRLEDITVELARQSGKNEISAQLESAILARYGRQGGTIVKAAPTWSPQIVRSKHRLEARTRAVHKKLPFLTFQGREGYIMECGEAAINFLSGRPTANVVGDTASLLMEIDEAQDFGIAKYDREFAPMRAATGAPAVFYGTTWTDNTLLERTKVAIQEGRIPGRVFLVPWTVVAQENTRYGQFVEAEIARLGADHPIIRTQYALDPIEEAGRLLKVQQLKQIIGDHPSADKRAAQGYIVAGLDFAGADEDADALGSTADHSSRDSVALTIGEVQWLTIAAGIILPFTTTLARYEWTNVHPTAMHTTLYDILQNKWQVDLLHADATGVGEVPTAYLARALGGSRVVAIKFDSAWNTQTRLAFQYIAAVNGSRLKDYQPTDFDPLKLAVQDHPPVTDPSQHIWWQRGHARLETRPGQRVRAYVPSNQGHDDLLISDMLMLDAAHGQTDGIGWSAWAKDQMQRMQEEADGA